MIWILIPIVAIIGGYIIDYQKNKLKWRAKNSQTDEQVEDLRKLVSQMKKRIENLEAIAAGNPGDFRQSDADPLDRIEIDEQDSIKKENEKNVADMAKVKGG